MGPDPGPSDGLTGGGRGHPPIPPASAPADRPERVEVEPGEALLVEQADEVLQVRLGGGHDRDQDFRFEADRVQDVQGAYRLAEIPFASEGVVAVGERVEAHADLVGEADQV